ncbi:MAG TPA: hypothetical protein VH253_02645 [Phycisphaerae bacterium]|nr:hypothetical protein [Phycisphaerae bacterium]
MSTVEGIVSRLADSGDLQSVLADAGLSAAELEKLLDTADGREMLRARRKLGRVHTKLLARRYSAYAILRMVQLLEDDKPEVRLKGAQAILEASGLDRPAAAAAGAAVRKQSSAETAGETPALEGTATAELLEALAAVLAQRRKEQEGD